MTPGGRRPHSGRKPRDTIRITFAICRPIYDELVSHEKATGLYRTRIAASLVTQRLIGKVVDRELSRYRAAAILTLLLLLMSPLWAQTGLRSSPASKPQIMVLGVFHLVSNKDMFTQQQGDTLTPKRQREIEQVVERLRAFHPTKIAVEHGYDGKLNERYQQYLSGKYLLTAEETVGRHFGPGRKLMEQLDEVLATRHHARSPSIQ